MWKSRLKKRILYLADRNILIDQTMANDFKPFGSVMTKIRHRRVDKSFEIYLALYQGISGTEEFQNIYREFSPDLFDLVVIDECHRGSAAEDSAWREILDYFGSAAQIGMTATPKETRFVSNIHYFGDPVYTYSLKQGIEDGFLVPYKVVRIDLDKDLGWRPEQGLRMNVCKRIALIAHDNRKFDLLEWARYNAGTLARHELYATGTTGRLLASELGLEVARFLSGPLGGDQQVGAGVAEGRIDFVIFFWDPLEPQPHDVDVKALLRIAVVHNVPIACNRATADFVLSSPLMETEYIRQVWDYGTPREMH